MVKPSAEHILQNSLWHKLMSKAAILAKKPKKVNALLTLSFIKLAAKMKDKEGWVQVKSDLYLTADMLKMSIKGDYTQLSKKSLFAIIASFSYFLLPTDFIPDFIPALGLLDDLTVFTWMLASVRHETKQFQAWQGISKV